MKPVHFTWTDSDEEYGNEGWLPKHIQGGFAASGFTFAHDVLEHGLGDTEGGFEGECQAFGAMIATRVAMGMIGTPYRPEWQDHIASDLSNFVRDRFMHNDESVRACPHRVRVPRDVGADIEECFRRALRESLGEAEHDDNVGVSKNNIRATYYRIRAHAVAWVRHGYRRTLTTMRRAGVDECDVGNLFTRLERAPRGEFEGQELIVRVNLKRHTVKFEFPTEEEY